MCSVTFFSERLRQPFQREADVLESENLGGWGGQLCLTRQAGIIFATDTMGNIGTNRHEGTGFKESLSYFTRPWWCLGIWHKKPGKGITGYDTNINMLITVKEFEPKINIKQVKDFPSGTVDKNWPANAGDTASILGLGRFHLPPTN